MIDTGYAWVIPFACFFIQGALFGSYRSYGLLYKVILDKFHVTRSDASWPFSLCMTVIHLTGPISGCLNKYTSVRVITFIGCCLASLGIALCYFASSVVHITLAIGLLQGFGIGLTYIQNSAIINEYFVKYRGTANGISLSGGTIGAFVISSILEYSLKQFQLKESFVILALIITLTLPVSCLLRQPSRNKSRQIEDALPVTKSTTAGATRVVDVINVNSLRKELNNIQDSSSETCVNTDTIKLPISSNDAEKRQHFSHFFTVFDSNNYWSLVPKGHKWSFFHETSSSNCSLVKTNSLASIFSSIGKQSKNTPNLMKESPSTIDLVPNVSLVKYQSNGKTFKSNDTIHSKEYLTATKLTSPSATFNSGVHLVDNYSTSGKEFYTHNDTICSGDNKSIIGKCDEEASSVDLNNSSNDASSVTSSIYCSCDESVVNGATHQQSSVKLTKSIKSIMKNPMFILIALTHASYFWSVITFTMVIVDYSLDKGITMNSTVALINSFSVGDLVGRLASGIILDSLHLQLKHISIFAISGIGACMVVTPAFAKLNYSFQLLAGVNVTLGLLSGLINVLLNNLFCLYVGSKHAALAFGLSAFISGILTLGRPSLVGYFRDRSGGSYDGLFITLGIASLITGALWLTEPFIKSKATPSPTIEAIIQHKCSIHRRNSCGSCTSNSSSSDTSSCDHNCIHHKSTSSIVTEKTLVSTPEIEIVPCKSPLPSTPTLVTCISSAAPLHPHPHLSS